MNCRECKHLKVLVSPAGYYIGTQLKGMPYCRISDYFESLELAEYALKMGCFELRDCVEINAVMNGLIHCEVNS
jgi:hypothetical protein